MIEPDRPKTPTAISTHEGTLILVTRVAASRLRTRTTKRRGTQCRLRLYDIVFPGIEDQVAEHWPRGWITANDPHAAEAKALGSARDSFYAFVTHKGFRRIRVVRFVPSHEAQAIMRRARQLRADAEWEAAAPERLR